MTQRRHPVPNGIYFITTNTLGGVPWFLKDELCKIVMESLWFNAELKHFTLFSFVIMPDHVHLLLQIHANDISECMRSFKTNAARQINRYLQSSARGATCAADFGWQRRFHDHVIRNTKDFEAHIEYIRYNPVKAKLVERPEDYPYLYVAPDEVLKDIF